MPPAITLLKLNRRVLYTKMHADGGGGGAVIGGIDRLELDRHFSDPAASLSSSLVRNDTTDTISEDDDATEASFGCPLSGANNHGTIRTAGWIRHTTSSYIKNKTQSSRKRPRYFVLRGNTISYYSRQHDVKAKGTYVLTSGCTVGPVVYASLDESLSTDDDQQQMQDGKTKKKKQQFYCIQITWPINNKPSKDEKIMAKAKAQVAAEREKEAMLDTALSGSAASSRSFDALIDEIGNASKTPSFPPRSPLNRNRSTDSRSKQFLGTIRTPKPSHRKIKSEILTNNSSINHHHNDDEMPSLNSPSHSLLDNADDSYNKNGILGTLSSVSGTAPFALQKSLQEQQQQQAINHETGLHKHYAQQIKKHAKDEQQSQEELQKVMMLLSRKAKNEKNKKRIIQGTKVAAVSGAAVTAGILTAGIGLAAGLVFVGITAAAGGSGAVVGGKVFDKAKGLLYERESQKSFHLILGTNTHEEAMKWKIALELAVKELLVDEDDCASWRLDSALSREDCKSPSITSPKKRTPTKSKVDSTYYVPSSRWAPIQGGGLALWGALGGGNLRIYREEGSPWYLEEQTNSAFPAIPRFRSDVGLVGQPFPPLKASLVLKAKSLDAFMSLMCSGRINFDGPPSTIPVPNSGQIASFRIIETMNDHLDVIHLVFRPLYLFPSWTAPRDFVLYRFWKHDDDGTYQIYFDSVEHCDCPPLAGYVRGGMHSVYTIAPLKQSKAIRRSATSSVGSPTRIPDSSKECLLSQVVQVDPRGWVPTRFSFLRNQGYGDAFAIMTLHQMLDVQEALDTRRFVAVPKSFTDPSEKRQRDIQGTRLFDGQPFIAQMGRLEPGDISDDEDLDEGNYEFQQTDLVSDSAPITSSELAMNPPPTILDWWAEPDANSFRVRSKNYLKDKQKINAGSSLFRLFAADIVEVDVPIMGGMCPHPKERVQLALARERVAKEKGLPSDMPPYVFVVNIVMPGPPNYHMVFYYAVDEMSKIDGSDGTPHSKLCKKFFFGGDDTFRGNTFKLIPCIIEGNFMVRKAVGSTPAIMGNKIKQTYVQGDRYFEIIIDTGSSSVGSGVIRICVGYARMIVTDLAFLFEGYDESTLPERVLGCMRLKNVEFGKKLRFVENVYD